MDFRVFNIGCEVNKTEGFSWDLGKSGRLHHRDQNGSVLEQKQSSKVSVLLAMGSHGSGHRDEPSLGQLGVGFAGSERLARRRTRGGGLWWLPADPSTAPFQRGGASPARAVALASRVAAGARCSPG